LFIFVSITQLSEFNLFEELSSPVMAVFDSNIDTNKTMIG